MAISASIPISVRVTEKILLNIRAHKRRGEADDHVVAIGAHADLQLVGAHKHIKQADLLPHFLRHIHTADVRQGGRFGQSRYLIGNAQAQVFENKRCDPGKNVVFECTEGIEPFLQPLGGQLLLEAFVHVADDVFPVLPAAD